MRVEPVPGQMIQSASDQCPGTIQWVDPGRPRIRVRWHDGTTSQEATEPDGWEYIEGTGHVCRAPGCRCPADGEWLYYAPAWGEHACPRVGCEYAHGPGPGGGWVGSLPRRGPGA